MQIPIKERNLSLKIYKKSEFYRKLANCYIFSRPLYFLNNL